MSKKSTRKTFREATTEETRPEECEYSESEEVDRHSPPHTSWQTNMTKDLMTILEFMEKKEISKEEKRLTEEQRRREEDQRKEELWERRYQEDADIFWFGKAQTKNKRVYECSRKQPASSYHY